MTTVSEKNIHEFPDIIDTVVQYKADIFSFARYCPVGHDNKNGISPQEYRQLLAQCDQKFKYYKNQHVSTYFNLKDHLWTLYRYETGEFKIIEIGAVKIVNGSKQKTFSSLIKR